MCIKATSSVTRNEKLLRLNETLVLECVNHTCSPCVKTMFSEGNQLAYLTTTSSIPGEKPDCDEDNMLAADVHESIWFVVPEKLNSVSHKISP